MTQVKEVETNTDDCDSGAALTHQHRVCRRYQRCGGKITRQELADAYDGDCFARLVWVCDSCGCENELSYKVEESPVRGIRLHNQPQSTSGTPQVRIRSEWGGNRKWRIV